MKIAKGFKTWSGGTYKLTDVRPVKEDKKQVLEFEYTEINGNVICFKNWDQQQIITRGALTRTIENIEINEKALLSRKVKFKELYNVK